MDNLHKTEAELEIEFNKPLSDQDLILKLNDLARKKRKHPDDIHDYFRSTKKFKSSDFVTIEDFGDFSNEMLYTIQEIFFRLHQGPWLDDHAKTFSSFLLAEVDKRNLNLLKQMRAIENLSLCCSLFGEIVGSVPEPFSLSVDLKIKSPKLKLAEDKFSFVSLKIVQLQLF
ncbi:hypothetical protein Tco_0068790, partial [Tanacetum coccineum]